MDDQYQPADEEIYSYRLLLECENSKRVVECKAKVGVLKSLLEDEVQKIVGAEANLVFDVAEYRHASRAVTKGYLLQRFSSEWNEYVDVINAFEIDTNDKLRAVPMQATPHPKMVSAGGFCSIA